MYKRNPSYKIYQSLNQVNNKLGARGGGINEIRLMNDKDFHVYINGKTQGKIVIVLYKIVFDDEKGCWK